MTYVGDTIYAWDVWISIGFTYIYKNWDINWRISSTRELVLKVKGQGKPLHLI